MSGRSGYRKTDRKRNRHALPKPKRDYVLRFQLPPLLAAFLSPGIHSFGVTIGFNDVVFVSGQNPSHCAQLAADFLETLSARQRPQTLKASIVKLLPCPAHHLPATREESFRPIAIDLEAVHDRVSRNSHNARGISIHIEVDRIIFAGAGWKFRIIHDFSDTAASSVRRA
jgi:hypothetical protein